MVGPSLTLPSAGESAASDVADSDIWHLIAMNQRMSKVMPYRREQDGIIGWSSGAASPVSDAAGPVIAGPHVTLTGTSMADLSNLIDEVSNLAWSWRGGCPGMCACGEC